MRDSQRSRVYAWERSQNPDGSIWKQTMSIEEVEAFVKRIWRSERGRYGKKAWQQAPMVEGYRGGTRAWAHGDSKLAFSKRCRNQYVALHELAHALNETHSGHDGRFVGILIGLLARHLGRDADALTASALEMGVKVHTRSIGAVPVYPWFKRVQKLLPCTVMDAAVELEVSYRVVLGALLQLEKRGLATRRRARAIHQTRMIPVVIEQPVVEEPVKKPGRPNWFKVVRDRAETYGIDVSKDDLCMGGEWWVYPPESIDGEDVDPYHGDHLADSQQEAKERVEAYIRILEPRS